MKNLNNYIQDRLVNLNIQEKLVINSKTKVDVTKFKSLDQIPEISNTDLNSMFDPIININDSVKENIRKNLQMHARIGSDFMKLADKTDKKQLVPKWWYCILLNIEEGYKAFQHELYSRLNLSEDTVFGFIKNRYERTIQQMSIYKSSSTQSYNKAKNRIIAIVNYLESYKIKGAEIPEEE